MSYIILRGRWCDIIVLYVHAPTEDKIDDLKDRFYEEVAHVFDKFPKYHIKFLPHQKILLSEVRCYYIVTFIYLLGHLLMGRSTTKSTIF
jgi:hypothetical protein